MKGAIDNPEIRARKTLYFAYREFQRGVKDDRYKLLEYVVNGRHVMTQLFDLHNDPSEMHNLAVDRRYSDVLHRLRSELERYSHEWKDRTSR